MSNIYKPDMPINDFIILIDGSGHNWQKAILTYARRYHKQDCQNPRGRGICGCTLEQYRQAMQTFIEQKKYISNKNKPDVHVPWLGKKSIEILKEFLTQDNEQLHNMCQDTVYNKLGQPQRVKK